MSSHSPGIASAAGLAIAGFVAALVDALGRDGVRAGAWAPEPLPSGLLLVALFLVGTMVPRRPLLPPRHALAALSAALLALVAVQVWRSTPADKPRALLARVGSGGTRQATELALHTLRTPVRTIESLGSASDLDVELAGFLIVPETGAYDFEIDCGGACTLAVDDRLLISGEGHSRATAALTSGVRLIRLALRRTVGRPYARFEWNGPAFFEASRLGDAIVPTPLAPDLDRRERRTLLRAAMQWMLAAAAALLALDLSAAARGVLPSVPGAARAWLSQGARRVGAAAGGAALLFVSALHAWIAPRALPGGYLHAWSSEFMMQTVSVADLREEPLRSLWFNHIQPPLFDALRAVLVAANPQAGDDPVALVAAVDRGLYACWAVAYALGAALIARWVAGLAGRTAGVMAALFYALHPATLFYATYLDSTFVSGLGVLWVSYELWRIGPGGQGSAPRLCAAVAALFLTRSIVQWPFVVVLLAALLLRGCQARRATRMMAVLGLVMSVFLAKQFVLFGLVITSSFGPDSFCKGLREYCPGIIAVDLPETAAPAAASALRRVAKVNDEYNYNQLAFLKRSFSQMEEYKARLRGLTPTEIARRLLPNLSKWLMPSSRHSAHVLADALPWRGPFDRLMSGWVLVALLLTAVSAWLVSSWPDRPALRAGLGLALPALYVVAVSVAFESNENMRYKFFVEPVLIVLLVSQAAVLVRGRHGASRSSLEPQLQAELDLTTGGGGGGDATPGGGDHG